MACYAGPAPGVKRLRVGSVPFGTGLEIRAQHKHSTVAVTQVKEAELAAL